jgi:hypothetical protein
VNAVRQRALRLLLLGSLAFVAAIVTFAITGPKAGSPARLIGTLAGAGLLLFLVGLVQWTHESVRDHGRQGATVRLGGWIAGMVALLGVGGLLTNAMLNRSDRKLSAVCEAAGRLPTVTERWARLADVETDPRVGLRRVFWEDIPWSCYQLRVQLETLERVGECPTHPVPGIRCTCGRERFPEDWSGLESPMCDHYQEPKRLVSTHDRR